MSAAGAELRDVIEAARAAGFLGPGPIEAHLAHAGGFAQAAEAALGRAPVGFVDLGPGGGIPGLVLAERWTEASGLFVESNQRRCAALRSATVRLGLEERIEVLEERAENAGAPGRNRERFEVVTARSFAGPAVTAEIAAGFVAVGGVLVVSEPPDPDGGRWASAGLVELGFGLPTPGIFAEAHFVTVRKLASTPAQYPRRVGKPGKRPLW